MFFHNALKKLEESDAFKDWKKDHPKTFLSTGFIVIENKMQKPWMIGYYDTSDDKISSFIVTEQECTFEKTDEVFKKEEDTVFEIDLEKVKVDIEELMGLVEKFCKEKYSAETVIKNILILQNLAEFGTVWNITLVTQAFNAINMKINAESGKLLDDSMTSLISYTAG